MHPSYSNSNILYLSEITQMSRTILIFHNPNSMEQTQNSTGQKICGNVDENTPTNHHIIPWKNFSAVENWKFDKDYIEA